MAETEPIDDGEVLVFRGRLTEEDVTDIRWCLNRLTVRRSIRWLAYGLAAIVAALCLAAIVVMFRQGLSASIGLLVVTLLVLFYWAFFLLWLPREQAWRARRHYRRHPEDYLETKVTLTGDHVVTENTDGKSELRWKWVGFVVDVPAGLMFLDTGGRMMFWLPSRLLDGEGLRERVLGLARSKGNRVRRRP